MHAHFVSILGYWSRHRNRFYYKEWLSESRQLFPLSSIVWACELQLAPQVCTIATCEFTSQVASLRLANSHRKSAKCDLRIRIVSLWGATCEFASQVTILRLVNSHARCILRICIVSVRGAIFKFASQGCEVRLANSHARCDLRIRTESRKSAHSHYLCRSLLMTSSINRALMTSDWINLVRWHIESLNDIIHQP